MTNTNYLPAGLAYIFYVLSPLQTWMGFNDFSLSAHGRTVKALHLSALSSWGGISLLFSYRVQGVLIGDFCHWPSFFLGSPRQLQPTIRCRLLDHFIRSVKASLSLFAARFSWQPSARSRIQVDDILRPRLGRSHGGGIFLNDFVKFKGHCCQKREYNSKPKHNNCHFKKSESFFLIHQT